MNLNYLLEKLCYIDKKKMGVKLSLVHFLYIKKIMKKIKHKTKVIYHYSIYFLKLGK